MTRALVDFMATQAGSSADFAGSCVIILHHACRHIAKGQVLSAGHGYSYG